LWPAAAASALNAGLGRVRRFGRGNASDPECRVFAHLDAIRQAHPAVAVADQEQTRELRGAPFEFLQAIRVSDRHFVAWNGDNLVKEFSTSLHAERTPYYEIAYEGPPSLTHLVKVQVYAAEGVGEDTGFEMAFD